MFSAIAQFNAARMPRTVELIYAGLRLAFIVEMRLKHALACRRPHEFSPQIQPIIPSPLHGALPSGHATEGFLFAHILFKLIEGLKGSSADYSVWNEQLMRQASRIAVNRTIAGVHFPIDSVAGCLLGLTLSEYFVALCNSETCCADDSDCICEDDCTGETHYRSIEFDGTQYPVDEERQDFNWENYYNTEAHQMDIDPLTDSNQPRTYAEASPKNNPLGEGSPVLCWLWQEARKEWRWKEGVCEAEPCDGEEPNGGEE